MNYHLVLCNALYCIASNSFLLLISFSLSHFSKAQQSEFHNENGWSNSIIHVCVTISYSLIWIQQYCKYTFFLCSNILIIVTGILALLTNSLFISLLISAQSTLIYNINFQYIYEVMEISSHT